MPLHRPLLTLLLGLACQPLWAQDIVFVAATNHTEPLSRFEKGQLVGGIIKDLGDALARRMALRPRYLSMPSKRAPMALRDGEGDLLCYTRAQWIGPDFQFTLPLIPNAEVVAARPEAPQLQRVGDLADRPVGTVLGYLRRGRGRPGRAPAPPGCPRHAGQYAQAGGQAHGLRHCRPPGAA